MANKSNERNAVKVTNSLYGAVHDRRHWTLCVMRTGIRALPNPSPPVGIRWDKEEAEVEVAEDSEEKL